MTLSIHYPLKADKSLTPRLGPVLTSVRATNAGYTDSAGLYAIASNEVPRFTHDADGSSLGLLIESSRTNLVTYSEDFTDASWSKIENGPGEITVTANQGTAPDGNLTADQIDVPAVSGGVDFTLLRDSVSNAVNAYRTLYVKALAAGDVGKTIHIYGNTANTNTAHVLTSDWQRIEFNDSGSHLTFGVLGTNYTDGVSQAAVSFLVWGAQMEAGDFASTYIPTDGATVTRNSDRITVNPNGEGFNDDHTGTWYIRMSHYVWPPDSVEYAMYYAGNGATAGIRGRTGGTQEILANTDGVDCFIQQANPAMVSGVMQRYAVRIAENDCKAYADGSLIAADTSYDPHGGGAPNLFELGGGGSNDATRWNGIIEEFAYWTDYKDDDTLEGLSDGSIPPGASLSNLIAVTRRTASQMRPKQRMKKPRNSLRSFFE